MNLGRRVHLANLKGFVDEWRPSVVLGAITFAIVVLFALIFLPVAFIPLFMLVVISGVALSRRDEVTAITMLIAATMFIPGDRRLGPLGAIGVPGTLVGGGLLLLWLYSRCSPNLGADRGRQPLRILAIVMLVATLASYVAGQVRGLLPAEVTVSDAALLGLASGLGVMLFASDSIRDMAVLHRVIERITLGAALMSIVAILQYFNIIDLAALVKFPGLTVEAKSAENIFVIERGGLNRVAGTATHPIELSVALAMCFPLALHMVLTAPPERRARSWTILSLIAITLPLTISRSGILAVAVAAVLYCSCLKIRTIVNLLPLALAGMAAVAVAAPGVLGTLKGFLLATGNEPSSDARTEDYPIVIAQWREHPILGRGVGTYIPDLYRVVDNQYLVTLVSTGVIGLFVLIAFFCTGYSLGRRINRYANNDSERQLGQALAAAIAAAAVASYTFDSMAFLIVFILTHLLVGCAGALWRISVRDGGQALSATPVPVAEGER